MDEKKLFEENVSRYKGKVLTMISRYVHCEHIRQDLLQQAFLRAWVSRDSFLGDCQYSTWLIKIAINVTLNYLIRNKTKIKVLSRVLQEKEHFTLVQHYMYIAPDNYLSAMETLTEVERQMQKLPRELREAIVLSAVYGYEYADVAKMCRVPVGTIKSRIHRARAILKKACKEKL